MLSGKARLVISQAVVVIAQNQCQLYSRHIQIDLLIYPALDVTSDEGVVTICSEGLFRRTEFVLRHLSSLERD